VLGQHTEHTFESAIEEYLVSSGGYTRGDWGAFDRFDALCNDLTSGIPAEIEARRKQYEYYRDKLLTFKEASA
jgi:hypothetical protein